MRWLWGWAVLIVGIGCDGSEPGPVSGGPCPALGYSDWETSEYVLPYPVGRAYVLLQGNCGGFSHTVGSAIVYAYDFRMPIGEPVTAARAGRVVHVEESYEDYDNVRGHENGVLVEHTDGSVGAYVHFTRDGAAVEVGDEVVAGDTLGWSGHTGFSTEPHLHFDVRTGCENQQCSSIPVTFRNTLPNPRGLSRGVLYPAQPY